MTVVDAPWMAVDMTGEVPWPLCLGFLLSGVVQTLVSHRALARTPGDASPKRLSLATLFEVASRSRAHAAGTRDDRGRACCFRSEGCPHGFDGDRGRHARAAVGNAERAPAHGQA